MKVKNIKDKIKAKVAAKTNGLKDKITAKVVRKCVEACILLTCGLCAALAGCHMGELPTSQPTAQRAQTSTIHDNQIDIRVLAPTNVVYDAEGNPVAAVRIEIGNLTQANETSGTESQTATQTASPSNTPTVSVPIRIDARYNDAIAAATPASKAVLGSLVDGAGEVLDLMASKKDGRVNAKTTDGKDVVVECSGGQCSICEDSTDK